MDYRNLWARLGVDRQAMKRLLRFDADPALELRLQAMAVRRKGFYRANEDYLVPEMWSTEVAEKFAAMVKDYVDTYRVPPDKVSAMQWAMSLPPGTTRDSLTQHVTSVYNTNIAHEAYAERALQKMAKKRILRAAAVRISDMADWDDWGDTNQILDTMQAAVGLVSRTRGKGMSLQQDYSLAPRFLENQTGGITTGLRYLDRLLCGGIRRGELGVIIAPPKRGKTLVMVNLAAAALLSGYNVLYITYEDGEEAIMARVCCRILGQSRADVLKDPNMAISNLKIIMGQLHSDLMIVEHEATRMGVADVEAAIEEFNVTSPRPVDLVIMDYVDKMSLSGSGADKNYTRLALTYTEVRAMLRRCRVAGWTGSQMDREGYRAGRRKGFEENPDGSNVAGAFAKIAEADLNLILMQNKDEDQHGEARLKAEALRNRPSGGIVRMYVDRERSTISEAPPIST